MNNNTVPLVKPSMRPDAKAFNLALQDLAILHQNLTVKIKPPGVEIKNIIVFNKFISRLQTFACDEMVNEVIVNFRSIYAHFVGCPNGFSDEELVILKQKIISIQCLICGEWWDKVMDYQYELDKQKNLNTAVNHCQKVMEHAVIAQKSFASEPTDIYANFLACKVAYALEYVPENMAENLVSFQHLRRIFNESDDRDTFSPFYQKAESMIIRIENGLSPNGTRGISKIDFVM